MSKLIRPGSTIVSLLFLVVACQGIAQAQRPSSPAGVLAASPPPMYRATSFEARTALNRSNEIKSPGVGLTNQERAHAEFQKGISFIEAKLPQYAEAERAFQTAMVLDPAMTIPAYSGLGYVYTATRRYDDAERTYKMVLGWAPKSAETHFNLGAVYMYKGETQLALTEVETLKKLSNKLSTRLRKLIESQSKK